MATKKDIIDALIYRRVELEEVIKHMREEVIRLNTQIQDRMEQLEFINITLEDKDE